MTTTDLLAKQTENAYDWTNQLLSAIPYEKWDITPEVIESNTTWQTGHLVMSFYYHTIMVIAGHQMDILQKVPLKEYDALFTAAPPINAKGKVNSETLYQQLLLVEQKSLGIIRALSPEQLDSPLIPTPTPHPIAKTKYEALDWNIKHTLWHCGQLAMLKRVVDKRFDFGLQRPE